MTFVNKTGINANAYRVTNANNSGEVALSNPQKNEVDNKLTDLNTKLIQEKKKNGLIEKFYDFCKNTTGLGIGSKKVGQKILEYENGQLTEEEAKKKLSDYKISQENSAQHFGDLASGLVAVTGYFGFSNAVKHIKARLELNALPLGLSHLKDEKTTKVISQIKNVLNSKSKTTLIVLPFLAIAGGMTKYFLLKFNRLGSNEFKVENKEKLNKKEFKKAKRKLNNKRHDLNFKNFYTGAFNGLMAPITAISGGIVGVPAYILATSGMRFLTSKNDKKDKSINNYIENLKNNIVLDSLFTAAIAVPALKKAKNSKILSENLNKVVKKLKEVKFKNLDYSLNKTTYDELEEIMLTSPGIKEILSKSTSKNTNESIQRLTKENIFAVKFLQISKRGGNISSALIENCPPSRTISEAQREINKLLSSDKYKVSKLLGVGTVAESYLAKDKSGKEVCIKILKDGINLKKIQKDKEAFIKMIIGDTPKEKLSKPKQYLVKNIENLADAISKEIDFENEFKAAQKLKKYTKQADVVVPIEVKPGVYVMEKAPGISLDTLVKYYQYESVINYYKLDLKKDGEFAEYAQKIIDDYTKEIEKLKAKSPDFKDFNLSEKEINLLLKKYIDVMTEQFAKIDKNGKTLHADIHPGNIFINLEALKGKKGKLFTLIDTGNTIDLTKEQAIASLKLTNFVKNGNVKDITKYVMDDAVLPKRMTQEKAANLIEQELNRIFFKDDIKVNSMNTDELLILTSNILRKHHIIPTDTQLNLNKAKISANNSFYGLLGSFFGKKYSGVDISKMSKKKQKLVELDYTKDFILKLSGPVFARSIQENLNLLKMSPKEIINHFKNPNMIKTNSEEHLIYKLKQDINKELEKELK